MISSNVVALHGCRSSVGVGRGANSAIMIGRDGFQLSRHPASPILSPYLERDWEALVATNPGAWHVEASGEVLLLYRCAGRAGDHTAGRVAAAPLDAAGRRVLSIPSRASR